MTEVENEKIRQRVETTTNWDDVNPLIEQMNDEGWELKSCTPNTMYSMEYGMKPTVADWWYEWVLIFRRDD